MCVRVSNLFVYSVSQFMSFFADTVALRTNPGQRQSVEEGDSK